MTFNNTKILQLILIISSLTILLYAYYYLPKKNTGSIKAKTNEEIQTINEIKIKNTFKNTEYITRDKKNKIYTTRAKSSEVLQNNPDLIYLDGVYSFTRLKKDNSLIEITSDMGLHDKKNQDITYKKNVIITNKNYLITADLAKHISRKNLIIINGNVIMKDLTDTLTHVVYCDVVEIDTTTNNAIAYMNYNKVPNYDFEIINDKVIAKKFK